MIGKKMCTDTTERGLEALIERYLLEEKGYERGRPVDYDRSWCVDTVQLFRFLKETQPVVFEQLQIEQAGRKQDKFFKRLSDQIKSHGIVEVLRKGIKTGENSLRLYYPFPASDLNQKVVSDYGKNIFSVTRQLHYSNDNTQLSLDMTVFINGLPLITFELKNNLTKQNVKDAIRQYQNDRDPHESLFALGRCMVHLAVDDNMVYMTTHLKGRDTIFLPFNKGYNHGAGNPPNPDGIKTDYLWKDILQKESLSNIIERYAQIIVEEDEKGRKKKKLIFPRYHQLDVVKTLLSDCQKIGTGKRYLIQHSAGSGKSNSITWLAHQLVELKLPGNDEDPLFDSVIVITDRRVLDKQIRDNIKQFAHVKKVVEAITKGARQLKDALEDGKKIIISTVQKFPFIVNEIQAMSNNRFAIIIDEAHSSQGGKVSGKMNAALGAGEAEEGEELSIEDRINEVIEKKKMLKNASYFAFTATPKNKTLEIFGIPVHGASQKRQPHHTYSMKQAIEEGFILDVLRNYTTYQSYYKLKKKIEDDPAFDSKKAQKKLTKYVEGHKLAIQQKAKIMLDHFLDEVIAKRKINGQAKAMVVTSGIVNAIKYKYAFDTYLGQIKSDYKAIVAFSGTKQYEGQKLDEEKMNGFPSVDIPKRFNGKDYRFLIVAEKFQTGFDQPLLHTMYVDKVLSGVKTVQTLSRLNRCLRPYKHDIFVLDFVNTANQIKKDFEPFYKTSILSEETSIDRLNDLQDSLDSIQVYSKEQVEDLMTRYITGAPRESLDPILDECVQSYVDDLDEDKQVRFKSESKGFVRMYQFLSQIHTFSNVYWESLSTFLSLVIPKLPTPEGPDLSKGILEAIDMDTYGVEQKETQTIHLEGDEEVAPVPTGIGGGIPEPEMDSLSRIISAFNERFGKAWLENTNIKKFIFEDLPKAVMNDEEYLNAKKNSDRQNAKITYEKKVVAKFQEIIFDQTELYRKFTDDPEFKKWLCDTLFRIDYDDAA